RGCWNRPARHPPLFGELRTPGATRTVVFYAHYDGQPVDTSQWMTPPWSPTLRARLGGEIIPLPTQPGTIQGESRLYAPSACAARWDWSLPYTVLRALCIAATMATGRRIRSWCSRT